MASIMTDREVVTTIDADGVETQTTKERTRKIERSSEPDYVKIYTKMWCEYNRIPNRWRDLFFALVCRMGYCNSAELDASQTVAVVGPIRKAIMQQLGWTSDSAIKTGLRELCRCNAIKRLGGGVYQINPEYAGRGEWKYNPSKNQGGIEDLVATFRFKAGTVDTQIIWADDGKDNNLNRMYRDGLQTHKGDNARLSSVTIKPQTQDDVPEFNDMIGGDDNYDDVQ